MGPSTHVVLVVEDDEYCATTLEIALQAVPGVNIRVAACATEALGMLQATRVSIVVTDLRLPDMDGFELISRIRSDGRMKTLPIIVFSGNANPKGRERALELGANAFFGKPCSMASLRQKAEELLEWKTTAAST